MTSQRRFYFVVAAAAAAGAAFLVSSTRKSSSVSIPANVVVTANDTSGFHGYVLGSASAPIEVTEYGDLECPGCAVFSQIQFPDVKARLIDPGKIRLRYRDYPWDQLHKHPRVAAHAVACANEQGHSWDVIEKMFATQEAWALARDPIPALRDIVKGVGGNPDTWTTCMQSAKFAGRIQASLDEGKALGVGVTPSFIIGGRIFAGITGDEMVRVVDSLIAAATPQKPAKPTGN